MATIIGHRGARREVPENTLPGFAHLRSLGIHQVELDVHLSADNVLMVIHDTTVDRTTDHSGTVASLRAAELAKMNATGNLQINPTERGIPTLKAVLEAWPDLQHIQIEIKPAPAHQYPALADGLCEVIRHFNLYDAAYVTSSDIAFLRHLGAQYPLIKRGLVADQWFRAPLRTCGTLDCELLALHWRRCTPRLIRNAHANGIAVSVWTVNRSSTASRLARWGVDSIITDIPSTLAPSGHTY